MENKEDKVEKLETVVAEPSEGSVAVAAKKIGFGQKIANAFKKFFTREHLKEFAKKHIYELHQNNRTHYGR